MMDTTSKLSRIVNRVLVALFAIGVIALALRWISGSIFPLLGLRWWAIIFLLILVAFLVYLTTAIRRYNERMILRVEAQYNAAICEWERCVLVVCALSPVIDAGKALYVRLADVGDVDKHQLTLWLSRLEMSISDSLGTDRLISFRGGSLNPPNVPNSREEQLAFLNQRTMKLADLMAEYRRPKPPFDIIRRPE